MNLKFMNGLDIFPIASFLVLIILIGGKVIFLKKKGIQITAGESKTSKTRNLINTIFFAIVLLWIFEAARPLLSFSILPEPMTKLLLNSIYIKIAGISIIAVSLVLLFVTLLHFKNHLRFGLSEKNPGKLVTTGIFSISRNPFFLSLDLYFLGIAIFLPNLFFIGFAVLAVFSIHFFILNEEKFMRKVYSAEYEIYLSEVKRYI